MDQIGIVKRAFAITWRYRVLWVFGFLLALTGGGGGGGGGSNAFFRGGGNGGQAGGWPSGADLPQLSSSNLLAIVALCCILLFVVIVILTIVRYVSQAALYRMVDQVDTTGTAPTWREGFRLGWSNRTFRLFLLDLLVGVPFFLAALILLGLAASPLLLLMTQSGALKALGVVGAIGLILLVILLLVVAGAVIRLLGQFWSREVVIADRSVGEALAVGVQLVRSRIKDVGVMWLLTFGAGLLFGIVMIPIALVFVVIAFAAGGGLGFAVYAASHSVIAAVAVGLPIGLLLLVPPLSAVEGLYLVWESSAWTLAYREAVTSGAAPAQGAQP